MRHLSLFAAAAALVFSSSSFAQSSAPAPSAAAQAEMGIQLARDLGTAMSAMPEMQQACGHTADQKRRVKRVISYLEEQVTKGSGPAAGAAYREAVKDGSWKTRTMLAGKSPSDIARACVVVNQSFESELQRAELEIPASYVPSTFGAASGNKPAAKAATPSAPKPLPKSEPKKATPAAKP